MADHPRKHHCIQLLQKLKILEVFPSFYHSNEQKMIANDYSKLLPYKLVINISTKHGIGWYTVET
jgi:hypothetical protein